MKSITINTVQGIGDLFWCYQKLSPYYDEININISIIDTSDLQLRACNFVKLLPKVNKISTRLVTPDQYTRLWSQHYKMADFIDKKDPTVNYAVNYPLEKGIRLEDIDFGYKVETNVDILRAEYAPEGLEKDYAVLYVSGSKPSNFKTWTEKQWVLLIKEIYKKYELGNLQLALTGASYDLDVLNSVKKMLQREGIKVIACYCPIAEYCTLVKGAKFFVGYQSGLSIIADNYDIPQVMMYFDYLKPMLTTWCKKEHITDGTFNPFVFSQPPHEVANLLKMRIK